MSDFPNSELVYRGSIAHPLGVQKILLGRDELWCLSNEFRRGWFVLDLESGKRINKDESTNNK